MCSQHLAKSLAGRTQGGRTPSSRNSVGPYKAKPSLGTEATVKRRRRNREQVDVLNGKMYFHSTRMGCW